MSGKFEGYSRIPLDYPIDALALEASRRSRILGRPYSYGQLIADTTPEEREKIAEEYRERLAAVIRQGGAPGVRRHKIHPATDGKGSGTADETEGRKTVRGVIPRTTARGG